MGFGSLTGEIAELSRVNFPLELSPVRIPRDSQYVLLQAVLQDRGAIPAKLQSQRNLAALQEAARTLGPMVPILAPPVGGESAMTPRPKLIASSAFGISVGGGDWRRGILWG